MTSNTTLKVPYFLALFISRLAAGTPYKDPPQSWGLNTNLTCTWLHRSALLWLHNGKHWQCQQRPTWLRPDDIMVHIDTVTTFPLSSLPTSWPLTRGQNEVALPHPTAQTIPRHTDWRILHPTIHFSVMWCQLYLHPVLWGGIGSYRRYHTAERTTHRASSSNDY